MNNVVERELKIVTKNVGLSALYFIIGYPLSIIIGIIIAKVVGAENLGLITIGQSFVQLLAFFSLLGMDRGLLKYVAANLGNKDKTNIKKIVKFTILTSFTTTLIIMILYFNFYEILNKILYPNIPNISNIIFYFVIFLPVLVLINIFKGSLNGMQRPQYGRIQQKLIFPSVRIILLILFVSFFSKLTSLLWATLISLTISALFMLLMISKEIKRPVDIQNNFSNVIKYKDFIYFSLPLILIPLFDLATHSIDTLIVSHYLNAASTGVYSIVRRFGFFVALPLSLFTAMIGATASKMFTLNQVEEFKKIYQFSTKWIVFFSSIIFSILFIYSNEILIFLGKDFVMGSLPLKIFIFSQLINAMVGPTGSTLLMTNKKNIFIMNSLLSVILGLGSSFYLIPHYGLIGAAISISLAFSLVNILCVYVVIKNFKIYPMKVKELLYRITAIVLSILVNILILTKLDILRNLEFLRLCIGSLIIIILISSFYTLVEKLKKEDKYIIKKLIYRLGLNY